MLFGLRVEYLATKDGWGLVMFQETHLLRQPEEISAAADTQYVALTVCHEIVKLWVGTMVQFLLFLHIVQRVAMLDNYNLTK